MRTPASSATGAISLAKEAKLSHNSSSLYSRPCVSPSPVKTAAGSLGEPRHVKGPRPRAAPGLLRRRAPHAVGHVGIGRIGNVGLAQVADVRLVLGDFLVAVGQVEGDGIDVVDAAIAQAVELDAAAGKVLSATAIVLGAGLGCTDPSHCVFDAHLPHKGHFLLARLWGHLGRDLEAGRYFNVAFDGHGDLPFAAKGWGGIAPQI